MDDSLQDLLKKAWHGGRQGYLSPLSEARAWALREIWREEGKPEYGMLTYIATVRLRLLLTVCFPPILGELGGQWAF